MNGLNMATVSLSGLTLTMKSQNTQTARMARPTKRSTKEIQSKI